MKYRTSWLNKNPMHTETFLPPHIKVTADKIKRFHGYKPGWHFGSGQPPSENNVRLALMLNAALGEANFPRTGAFLGTGGELQVTAYLNKTFLEFTIEADGSVTFAHEESGQTEMYVEGLTFQQALDKIFECKKALWSTFASCTGSTSMNNLDALAALHSRTRQGAESPLLMKNVQSPKVMAYVLTCTTTTSKIHQSWQYSGQ